jgi:putative hydrolase
MAVTVDQAFERIIYLLDRSLAPPPKVRAFTNARAVAAEVGEHELRRRIADNTLTDLAGIGASTGAVITEALSGAEPEYLTELEESTAIPLEEGADLRAALRGDCHAHSTWSDGGASIRSMAEAAEALGHEYLVITDHSPRLTVAHGLDAERLRDQLAEIEALNDELAPFRILTGIEVDILEDGSLDQDEQLLASLDVVVASVHSKLRLPREEMTRRMVLAIASPHTDILGHCTNRKLAGRGRPPSDFDAEIVFAACQKFDTAVEINCRPERQDPPDELLALALQWECPIAIDTDAHAPGQLEWQNFGCDKAVCHGVGITDVVNTRSADDLLAWTASHR